MRRPSWATAAAAPKMRPRPGPGFGWGLKAAVGEERGSLSGEGIGEGPGLLARERKGARGGGKEDQTEPRCAPTWLGQG